MKRRIIISTVIVITLMVGVIFLSFNNKPETSQTIEYEYENDGIILMRNVETGEQACFGCGTLVDGQAVCIDPIPAMDARIESDDIYCNSNFEVIQ